MNLACSSRGSAPSPDLFDSKPSSRSVKCPIHTPEVENLDAREKRHPQILPALISHRIISIRVRLGVRKRSRCCGVMQQVCVAHWCRGNIDTSAASSALTYDRGTTGHESFYDPLDAHDACACNDEALLWNTYLIQQTVCAQLLLDIT
jgi:hypothetical protein